MRLLIVNKLPRRRLRDGTMILEPTEPELQKVQEVQLSHLCLLKEAQVNYLPNNSSIS